MIIESLELKKVQNALNLNTSPADHIKTIDNLNTIKHYYAEIGDFILEEQGRNRMKTLEVEYLKELEKFFNFWKKVMDDFEEVKKEEIAKVIKSNKNLSDEMREILEKTTGFKAPPNSEFLQLLAIRKIAFKLRTNDAVKYLNFDYFKRKNKELNAEWINKRKESLEKRIKKFEELLEKNTVLIKSKINDELNKLHFKRQKQLDMLLIKYNKCKMLIENINAQEMIE